jgi:hypothetical protein
MVRVEVKSVSSGSLINVGPNTKKKQKTKKRREVNSSVKLQETDSNEVETRYIQSRGHSPKHPTISRRESQRETISPERDKWSRRSLPATIEFGGQIF